jgi:SAM-dependent methyltransferase
MKLDLGAGMTEQNGYLRADIAGRPEVRCDARRLPFADGSFEEVRLHHVLEHIERRDLVGVMNEVHRVLAEGGKVDIEVPVFPYWTAIADPTHCSFFVSQTFDYFDQGGQYADHMTLYGIKPWKITERRKLGAGEIIAVEMQKCQQ